MAQLASNSLHTPSVDGSQYKSLTSASFIETDSHHDAVFNKMYGALSTKQTDSTTYAVLLEDSSTEDLSTSTIAPEYDSIVTRPSDVRHSAGHAIMGDFAVPLAFSES